MSDIPLRVKQKIKEAKENNLITLYLSRNKLTNLPESLTNLTQLTTLYLSQNQLTNLPESLTNLTKLTRLDLSYNKLTNLPESLTNLTKLTRLDLSRNKLTNLPESLTNLTQLTRLDLSGNELTNLPESLTNLTQLTRLDLSGNELTNLPESLTNLTQLTALNLSYNKLINLPESLTNLTQLTTLYLNDNKLTNLPEFLTNLTQLTELNLSGNRITNLPEFLTNLTQLTTLYLNDNRITNLPESLTNLTQLSTLDLRGNPLESPPIEVAEKGIYAIREYFRQIKEEGKDYLYEAKLLIIGEPGAGKTTLAQKIQNPNYQLKEEDSTKGIDVIQWDFEMSNGQQFRVNIWDFGGQEIYKATHQFFLTKRSLYTLVADTRQEDTDFYYWLHTSELFGDQSPILIIKNEKQDRQREINQPTLRKQFLNLKETLATNLATNRGLADILTQIKHYISNLPHVGDALPKTWVRVREVLEKDERNYISLDNYLEICQENGFKKREDKLQLSGYLHDLGVCLHFQDDPLLKQTVILKPEWGTAAVYKVLDNATVINNLGKFTQANLENIWSEEKYINKQNELLKLMMKFKLCYQIPGANNDNIYIAPQLLTESQPDFNWDENNNLIIRYTYEFMPKGIITQFIVVMNKYIKEQKYVWKSGVILDKDQTLAEIIEYYDKREIKIRIIGKNKKDLMTIVTYKLDKIHDQFPPLKCDKWIPCNCQSCKNNQDPNFYPFEVLRDFAIDGDSIQCQKSRKMIDARSLIDDIINPVKKRQYEDYRTQTDELNASYNKQITINLHGDKVMTEQQNNDFRGASLGGGFAGKNYTGNVYNNTQEQKQNLAEAAAQIQQLLKQLETSYPTDTFNGKVALANQIVEEINNDLPLSKRILSALQAGGVQALDSLLDHPAASFVIGALEDWKDTQNSQ
ncbi:COR domain-containing protein [Crocosphaera sp. XPORK-15E]|uniref:COR domain-containing protein n=1 Tax=Crocosphaera sp. XPORK-15E TaxID=3110247 RepID=UPI002B1FD9D8|nr:COR domain-containing protein [Crocosphaera sp. XPORK-15E]MEA5532792.1 COR domain-containing protein [Crocosphaera sp. XPORK-15E]